MSITCDGEGNIAVQEIVDGVNNSLQPEDVGVTVQEDLVSGTNIKTINGESILDSGDIVMVALGVNALMNSGVTRINQRNFDGVSFVSGEYCWDRWLATASAMTQIIEEGDFLPNTVYTISGQDVATAQITSPASGNWKIPEISRAARNVKLEVGVTATAYRPLQRAFDLMLCQRYYEVLPVGVNFARENGTTNNGTYTWLFRVEKAVTPAITNPTSAGETIVAENISKSGVVFYTNDDDSNATNSTAIADAEIYS